MSRPAKEIQVNGIVQGVGFRPFVYRLAHELDLVGHITNRGDGVLITVAGDDRNIDCLVDSLRRDAPPLSNIISLDLRTVTLPDSRDFQLLHELDGKTAQTAAYYMLVR